MPSNEEIGDLLSKTSEYVDTYRQTFASARPSLVKAPTPGFYEKAIDLSKQADSVIAAIRKNGSSAYALVGLVTVLDDMSLNATRAYAVTMVATGRTALPVPRDAKVIAHRSLRFEDDGGAFFIAPWMHAQTIPERFLNHPYFQSAKKNGWVEVVGESKSNRRATLKHRR